MILVVKLRLRDKHAKELARQARAVNFVWNFCNERQREAVGKDRKWLSSADLQRLTAGSGPMLELHSHTVQKVCEQYEQSRRQHKRPWLRWRGKKSLGWVPFNQGHVKLRDGAFVFRGVAYEPMHMRELPEGAVIRAGSFNTDSRGRWYINLPVEFPEGWFEKAPESAVGIDLGLKTLATLSDGSTIENPRCFAKLEARLGKAQRSGKKRLTKTIHAKIVNSRKDFLHKASAAIAKAHAVIVVGDVSSSKLSQTKMAKSVQDAGWSNFRTMLSYKAIRHGGRAVEVSEAHTSRTCSSCGSLSGPSGVNGLGIREWTCVDCGVVHCRDGNAAKNILRRGLATLGEGARL